MARDTPRGDVPLLVLAVLAESPRHGYAIARAIEQEGEKVLQLREGALYPALRVLEQDGLITGAWDIQTSGPARKVYSITAEGQAELTKRTREWKQYARLMTNLLGGLEDAQPA